MNLPLVLLICLFFQFQGGLSIHTTQCKENEEYNECGSGCPLTCENYREPMFCTQYCKQGCFCKYGYVRGPDHKCILPNNCPIGPCGNNEVASTCVNPCNDCMQKGNCYYEECKRGCDCKPGYYKNSSNHCVIATECESAESMCAKNEHYVQCVNLCNDCWSRGYCDDNYCEPGCDCKSGNFRDENGLCVPESQCISHGTGCGENEYYSDCANPCNDCERKGHCRYNCEFGCDCKYGFYRNKKGVCVPASQCSTDSGISSKCYNCKSDCKENEEYYDCIPTCNSTCENYNQRGEYCSTTCNPGCFCKKGLVKNNLGECVSPSQCTIKCGMYEEYTECGSACQPSCSTLGKSIMCTQQCVKGCVCVTGYVKNNDGKCVKPSDCPVVCGIYEEYKECGTACPIHCANLTASSPCTKICVKGCFCSAGYVRGTDGTCILPHKCPIVCGDNEIYEECGSQCEPSCLPPSTRVCEKSCKKGCFCKAGYVRGPEGKCILPSYCPKRCGWYEEYRECGTACPKHCSNLTTPSTAPCPAVCVKGCYCQEGYVRGTDGTCIVPTKCPVGCGLYEEYRECGTACERHCSNLTVPVTAPCPAVCVKGCFCQEGYVRGPDGACILPTNCPAECGLYEEYRECGRACPRHCSNLTTPSTAPCPAVCVKGCFCQEGYVRGPDGTCILPTNCPAECQLYEEYRECGTACPKHCSNLTPFTAPCPAVCVNGCFCKEGYVRGPDGTCILPTNCPAECGLYEEYLKCGTACPRHCSNLTAPVTAPCPAACVKGCFCQEGYVRGPDGICIVPTKCPVECRLYEEYRECGTACPKHCSNLTIPSTAPCPVVCVKDCFCQEGYVRGPDGTCILPTNCPVGCALYEEYRECGTACPKHCSNLTTPFTAPCPAVCVNGCFCQEGYVRGPDGTCILPTNCPADCGLNEEYLECGTACQKHCSNLTTSSTVPCPTVCVKGCFCKEGYVRGPDGTCILPKSCPVVCSKKEVFKECGSACPPTCANRNRTCAEVCVTGCFCKPRYIRNESGKCILPRRCPLNCKENEVYMKCGPRCESTCKTPHRSSALCPACKKGCFCKPGFVRGPRRKCILYKECPSVCKENEEHKECGRACPATCSNRTPTCPEKCVKGCFCKPGYIKNQDGKCILPANCPHICNENEEYRECGTACPAICTNRNPKCRRECIKGCFCKNGYINDKNGKCILPTECPAICNENEEYRECGTACPANCTNRNPKCRRECVKGCFCKNGYIKNKNGKCILPTECPAVCNENEELKECGTACPASCTDRNPNCSETCVKGCFCKSGYIKDKQGKCILPTECPVACNKNEEFKECGTACPASCTDRNPNCSETCVKGCFCKSGYIKDKQGKCILLTECPAVCNEYEEFKECGTACPASCTDRNPICSEICVKGCYCKSGYIKDKQGKCILPTECPAVCNENEEFKECGAACPASCYNRNPECSETCVKGCFCRNGYIKDKYGKCILPTECPPVCGENEEFRDCGPTCIATCENRLRLEPCPLPCVKGCFCKPGYVKGPGDKCIFPDFCPKPECPENESFQSCGPACPLSCKNIGRPITCVLKCVKGCFCNDGYIRGPRGICIKPDSCPIVCKAFEEFKCSHPSCEGSCNDPLLSSPRCPLQCVDGCYCTNGLVRGPDNFCIPPTMCPRKCLLTNCPSRFGGRSGGSNTTDIEKEEVSTNSTETEETRVTLIDGSTAELTTTTLTSDNDTHSKELDEKVTTGVTTKSTLTSTSMIKDEAKETTLKTTENTENSVATTPVAENTTSISAVLITEKEASIPTTLTTSKDAPIITTLSTNKETLFSTLADPSVPVGTSPISQTTATVNDKATPLPTTNKAEDVPTTISTGKPSTSATTQFDTNITETITKIIRKDLPESTTPVNDEKNATIIQSDQTTTSTIITTNEKPI